jgi:hypothetical protein
MLKKTITHHNRQLVSVHVEDGMFCCQRPKVKAERKEKEKEKEKADIDYSQITQF